MLSLFSDFQLSFQHFSNFVIVKTKIMQMKFFKYHGAGNDFILVNNLKGKYHLSKAQIKTFCDRRFGIGADGLILLNQDTNLDFKMIYYNADGGEGTMCGNGGRCITAFAANQGIIQNQCTFNAIDGEHHAEIIEKQNNKMIVKLGMQESLLPEKRLKGWFIDTGSEHYIEFRNQVKDVDVQKDGSALRHHKEFSPNGANINFVSEHNNYLKIRTYERGVENETLACGTGATAVALTYSLCNNHVHSPITLKALGGTLKVYFKKKEERFTDIYLEGPTELVYEGFINI